ncbi:MAG: hypothetical protein IT563_17230 [Alphaproteobacteria bacterium]|nr:hypothetical protein [Alphaproteobacteria bacterium]
MAAKAERDLYAPVKAFLEKQGYSVKAEVRGCDVAARRGDEPLVIVELKRRFSLDLVLQGVDRLGLSPSVYLAVDGETARGRRRDRPDGRAARKLCRLLGLGLLLVFPDRKRGAGVEVVLDPLPYKPRIDKRRAGLLLGEHTRRVGDPNVGGVTRVKIVTAYRQEALRCAQLLGRDGPTSPKALRATGRAPKAASILRDDVYGWFQRVERGVYELSANGRQALQVYAAVLETLEPNQPPEGNAAPCPQPTAPRRRARA